MKRILDKWNPRDKTEKYLSCKILLCKLERIATSISSCVVPLPLPLHPSPKKHLHIPVVHRGHECLSGMFNLRKRSVFGSAVGSRNRSANPIAFSLVPRLSSSCSGNKFNGMVNTTDRRVHRNPKP